MVGGLVLLQQLSQFYQPFLAEELLRNWRRRTAGEHIQSFKNY